jgi:hypothetical protein
MLMTVINTFKPDGSNPNIREDITPVEKMKREREAIQAQIEQAELAEGKTPETPPEKTEQPPQKSADEIIGKLSRTKDQEKQLEILEQAGVEVGDGWETWQDMEADIEKSLTKQVKQESVTPAAVVGESSGTPTPNIGDSESILAELNALYAGKYGSLTKLANQKRMRELQDRLNKIDPPRMV